MVNYGAALKDGLEAAGAAKKAREEIDTVFKELNRQITITSNGTLIIEIKQFSRKPAPPPGTLTFFLAKPKSESYSAITARNPAIQNSPYEVLALWSYGKNGYPCEIDYSNRVQYCEDKVALENTLEGLLRDPWVGGQLSKVMKLKNKGSG